MFLFSKDEAYLLLHASHSQVVREDAGKVGYVSFEADAAAAEAVGDSDTIFRIEFVSPYAVGHGDYIQYVRRIERIVLL